MTFDFVEPRLAAVPLATKSKHSELQTARASFRVQCLPKPLSVVRALIPEVLTVTCDMMDERFNRGRSSCQGHARRKALFGDCTQASPLPEQSWMLTRPSKQWRIAGAAWREPPLFASRARRQALCVGLTSKSRSPRGMRRPARRAYPSETEPPEGHRLASRVFWERSE